MSYGLLLDFCCVHVACETIEIDFRISYCNVSFLLSQADPSMDRTFPYYKYYTLERCGGSFTCLCFSFSAGCLQVTTQKPITWKTARWSQALTTSRYVFFTPVIYFLNYFWCNELLFSSATQQLLLVLASSFLKLLYCVRVKGRADSAARPTFPYEIVGGPFWLPPADSYLMK